MEYSEYVRRLGADPHAADPEMQEARRSGPEFKAAKAASDRLEHRLRNTLLFEVSPELADQLLQASTQERSSRHRALAHAAGVMLFIGAMAIFNARQPPSLPLMDYVSEHYAHDGISITGEPGNSAAARQVFGELGIQASVELLKHISFVKKCPTPNGVGAHMLVAVDSGMAQVIFMPNSPVDKEQVFAFSDRQAQLVSLGPDSAAIITASGQSSEAISALLRTSLRAITVAG